MPITGSDKALMYAQGGVARGGATRGGYHSPRLFVNVDGIDRAFGKDTDSDKVQEFVVSESAGATPNKASFIARGWEPTMGMEIIAQLGSKNRLKRLFAGTVLSVNEANSGSYDNRVLSVQAVDWAWALNRTKVLGHYTGSATTIALELMSTYAPAGFTVLRVEAGLPTVQGGITFTNVDLSAALAQLAKRVPGLRHYIDYRKDLYFRVNESADLTNPTTLVRDLQTLKKFSISRDLSQVFTRVSMEGGGANAATEVAAGETILPLTDAPDTWYGDVGGVVLAGPQALTYTARVMGTGGSLVGPGAAPSSGPALALASGAGVTTGAHDVAVVFKTGAGQSIPGPRASITVGTIAAPGTGPVAGTPTFGPGPDAGDHYFAITNVTAAGETEPSPVSATVTTTAGHAAPAGAPTVLAPPTTGFGNLNIGDSYSYKYTYADSAGHETLPSPASTPVTVTASQRLEVTITYSTDPFFSRLYLYRSANGGGAPWTRVTIYLPGAFNPLPYLATTGGVGTQAIDDSQTPMTVAAPTYDSTGLLTVPLSGLPVPTSPLVTDRNLYGTAAGGSQLKFIAAIGIVNTTYNVTTADASLGANAPSSNTAAANQIAMTGVPIGGTGTTEREIYMTTSGNPGGTLKLALTIADNTTTTGTLTASDATLAGAASAPGSDTSGLTQPEGTVNPGSTTLLLAATADFRSAGGWAAIGNGSQAVRYTGITAGSLSGIPASGPGSITAAISYNSTVTPLSCLIGVPASGAGSVLYTIPKGQSVNCFVTVDDLAAQSVLAGLLDDGSDGVKTQTLQDRRLSRSEARSRAQAYLDVRAYHQPTATYTTKDMNVRAARQHEMDLEAPTSVQDTFVIQTVRISNFTPNIPPDYQVQASTELISIEDVLSREP
jgi:hypothetical protein